MTNFRALCARMADELDHYQQLLMDDRRATHALAAEARAALAQPEPQGLMPEVDDILRLAAIIRRVDGNHDKGAAALAEAILSHPDSRWQHAKPEPQGPSGEKLLEAFDQAVAAFPPVHSEAESLSAVEYARELEIRKARAVLARWGRPAIEPVPVSERLPGPEDCNAEGRCWWWDDDDDAMWRLSEHRPWLLWLTHWLPHWALPVPGVEGADA